MRKFFLSLAIILIPLALFANQGDTLKKAIDHIIAVHEPNTGFWSRLKGEFPGEAEPTSWAVKVLATNNVAPDQVEKGVAVLLKEQKPDGSWNNNSAHTAFTIYALNSVRKTDKVKEAISKGVDYLKGVQDEKGGFKRIGKEGAPLTIYTAVVLAAMQEAGYKKDDPMVMKALEWLVSCQNPDGGYGMPKGSPSLAASTSWTIVALSAYGIAPSERPVKGAVEWLLKTQKPSGGFSIVPPAPEDPEVTAYAIMGLVTQPNMKAVLDNAAAYLAKVQHHDGTYTSNLPIQFEKKAKRNTQTTLFVAWALTEMKKKEK